MKIRYVMYQVWAASEHTATTTECDLHYWDTAETLSAVLTVGMAELGWLVGAGSAGWLDWLGWLA